MPDQVRDEPIFLLVISGLILLSMLTKWGALRYARIPPVVGYIILGGLLRAVDGQWHFLTHGGEWTLSILAQLGVAALLFRVGLNSDVKGLLQQLPRALRVWIFDVTVSAGIAFVVTWLAGFGWVTATFVASALSATSVSISVVVWEDTRRLGSKLGQLLVDVAELDDLSAVILLLVSLAVVPIAQHGGDNSAMLSAAFSASGSMLLKVVLFGCACWIFARFLQQPFTKWLAKAARPPDRILTILGASFATAAIAGAIGFSVAVGALFAGLMFSRGNRTSEEEASFSPLYALFTPFFFIDVGYALDTSAIGTSFALGLLLFVPAVLGKLIGVGAPVAQSFGWRAGALFGVSMLPRAEIALLVARIGHRMGSWAISDEVYGGLVCAAGLVSIVSPLTLHRLFEAWPDLPNAEPSPLPAPAAAPATTSSTSLSKN